MSSLVLQGLQVVQAQPKCFTHNSCQ